MERANSHSNQLNRTMNGVTEGLELSVEQARGNLHSSGDLQGVAVVDDLLGDAVGLQPALDNLSVVLWWGDDLGDLLDGQEVSVLFVVRVADRVESLLQDVQVLLQRENSGQASGGDQKYLLQGNNEFDLRAERARLANDFPISWKVGGRSRSEDLALGSNDEANQKERDGKHVKL